MATPIIMPRQGISVETCIITEWHKRRVTAWKWAMCCFPMKRTKPALKRKPRKPVCCWRSFSKRIRKCRF